jgi:hypothetical protein
MRFTQSDCKSERRTQRGLPAPKPADASASPPRTWSTPKIARRDQAK